MDVTNKTYGIDTYDEEREKDVIVNVLFKDTPLPAEETGYFGTRYDHQELLSIPVHETECYDTIIEDLEDGNQIAEFVIDITEDLPAGSPIDVTFRLDKGGILRLLVENVATGETFPFEIKVDGCISTEEIEELTDKLAAVEFN